MNNQSIVYDNIFGRKHINDIPHIMHRDITRDMVNAGKFIAGEDHCTVFLYVPNKGSVDIGRMHPSLGHATAKHERIDLVNAFNTGECENTYNIVPRQSLACSRTAVTLFTVYTAVPQEIREYILQRLVATSKPVESNVNHIQEVKGYEVDDLFEEVEVETLKGRALSYAFAKALDIPIYFSDLKYADVNLHACSRIYNLKFEDKPVIICNLMNELIYHPGINSSDTPSVYNPHQNWTIFGGILDEFRVEFTKPTRSEVEASLAYGKVKYIANNYITAGMRAIIHYASKQRILVPDALLKLMEQGL
jgi:hypothetical protein